jgi:Flp pilus assembly protein CpaB
MRQSPRVVVLWCAALVVALVTARVVGGDLAALHQRARNLGPDVAVVLAAHDLRVGVVIDARDLHVVSRPARTVAADAVHDPNAVVGRVVAADLLRDDVVRAAHLAGAPGAGIDAIVATGRRAVHVVAKDGLRPSLGSIVDVLATFDPATAAGAGSDGRASIVAQGARVIATDDPAPGDTSATSPAGTTLLVTETEARAVAYAAAVGQVTLALAPAATACCR